MNFIITTKKEENLSEWYHEVIEATKLVDFSSVQGCVFYNDYCLAIWEQVKRFLDEKLIKLGFKEYYFPTLIPLSSFKKERKHFDYFFREVLVVSNVGNKRLNEEFVVRPTSEAIIYETFAKWINEEKDLPLLVNQYCSVIRWESFKPNMPLIRSNEFLWQESHSVHATEKEADKFVKDILDIYLDLHENYLAMPVIKGYKPLHRMFPGAKYTIALEALMPDLKSVQSSTSHSLGQNFSSVFNIKFRDKNGKEKLVWQACNGITTRVIGALVMLHGDNKGLVIPPKIAPYQVVLIDVKDKSILDLLKNNRLRHIADDSKKNSNERINYWILMGVPIIIMEDKNKLTLIRRDSFKKIVTNKNSLIKEVIKILNSIQNEIYKKAKNFNKKYITKVNSWRGFKDSAFNKGGFIESIWCGNPGCATKIREIKKYSVRVINPLKSYSKCVHCNNKASYLAIFAPAY